MKANEYLKVLKETDGALYRKVIQVKKRYGFFKDSEKQEPIQRSYVFGFIQSLVFCERVTKEEADLIYRYITL